MTLKELQVGKTATILSVGGNGALRQHFLDMGLIQGTEVTIVKYAPMGDPVEIRIHGYELTIRLEDAGQIEITPAHEPHYKKKEGRQPLGDAQHPGYGEAEENRASVTGEYDTYVCIGWKSELWKNNAVQPADRIESACGKFSRCYG